MSRRLKKKPHELADGRIRFEQDGFFHYLTKEDSLIDAFDRDVYQAAYTSPTAVRAGDAWYQSFPQGVFDDASYAKLTMPVLAVGGPGYGWLQAVMEPRAYDLKVVKADSGHFIPEEALAFLTEQLQVFLK